MKIIYKIFFICLFSNIVNADLVTKFEISGNQRVNEETIKMFSGIVVGDNITKNDLNKSLKKLYETNFFKDVNLILKNSTLFISVEENIIIQNLILNGIENKSLNDAILDSISSKDKSPFIENLVKKDISLIYDLLQTSGYYFANIELEQIDNNNNTIDLLLNINLGDKAFIDEIIFTGNKVFKKNRLLNVITSEENKFWKFLSSNRLLNKQRVELDKRLIKNFYQNKGYYQIEVKEETVQYNDDSRFKLIFNIDAGKKFYFNEFNIKLPTDYDESYFGNSLKKLNSYSGKKYSYNIIKKMLKEIENIASSNQYEFINANIDQKIVEDNKINIDIEIIDDDYKSYVQKINILGNSITIEDVIRNELIIDEGDPLNQILFSKSINNIKSLGIFKDVTSDIVDGDDEFTKVININVEEKPTGEISLGAGIGTSGASTMFGVRENNFLGQGIQLDSKLSLSEESISGLFSYTKNNYKNTDRDLILSAEVSETDRLKDFGYKSSDRGVLIGTRFEHLDDFFINPKASLNYESIETSSTASSMLKKQEGDYVDLNFNYLLDLDKRDQIFQPSDGYRSLFSQKIPLNIGDNQTLINSFELQTFHEFFEDITTSISISTEAATSFGDDDVRISERLYVPAKKLRGFESGKVGPIDNGDYVGGNYMSAFNINSNIPIFQSLESMRFNWFYDAANVWGVDYDSSLNESNKLRSSTGLAVNWYTPVGPLNFSFSQPITKKDTDKTESFRFSLGTTF